MTWINICKKNIIPFFYKIVKQLLQLFCSCIKIKTAIDLIYYMKNLTNILLNECINTLRNFIFYVKINYVVFHKLLIFINY